MVWFITRVELHGGATEPDYIKLHAAMREKGFGQHYTLSQTSYDLPSAEYFRVTEDYYPTNTVRDDAISAARSVWIRPFAVVVVKGLQIASYGLTQPDALTTSPAILKAPPPTPSPLFAKPR